MHYNTLSIVTINYNNLEGLRRTIDSIVNQTWKNFEWILIDGGSTDGSKELIEQTAAACPNITFWCSEPDKGVYNAMNKGIAHAKGEYLNFMNSGDSFCDEDVLQKVFQREYKADVLYGDFKWIYPDKCETFEMPDSVSLPFLLSKSLCHQATFIKRQLFSQMLYSEDYKIVSDWRQWLVWKKENRVFMHLNVFVANYDMGGISSVNWQQNCDERDMAIKELFFEDMVLVDNAIELFNYQERIENILHYNPELKDAYRVLTKSKWSKRLLRYILKFL